MTERPVDVRGPGGDRARQSSSRRGWNPRRASTRAPRHERTQLQIGRFPSCAKAAAGWWRGRFDQRRLAPPAGPPVRSHAQHGFRSDKISARQRKGCRNLGKGCPKLLLGRWSSAPLRPSAVPGTLGPARTCPPILVVKARRGNARGCCPPCSPRGLTAPAPATEPFTYREQAHGPCRARTYDLRIKSPVEAAAA